MALPRVLLVVVLAMAVLVMRLPGRRGRRGAALISLA